MVAVIKTRECLECGKLFVINTNGAGVKYCSKECQSESNRRRARELYQEKYKERYKGKYNESAREKYREERTKKVVAEGRRKRQGNLVLTIADVQRMARAAGMSYGRYVALRLTPGATVHRKIG